MKFKSKAELHGFRFVGVKDNDAKKISNERFALCRASLIENVALPSQSYSERELYKNNVETATIERT